MITALLLVLAQTATATPAPRLQGGFGQPKPTASAARVVIDETNLAPTGAGKGTFSIGNISGAPALRMPVPDASGDAAKAQARMDAAARDGSWVAGNIRYNTRILGGARSEWDAVALDTKTARGAGFSAQGVTGRDIGGRKVPDRATR